MIGIKKTFAIVLVLSIFVLLLLSANALNIEEGLILPTLPDADDIINLYRTEEDVTYTIIGSKDLYDFSGEQVYTLYQLAPYGFAILFDETNGLMEACYVQGAQSPIDITSDERYCYGGPGTYCEITPDGLLDIYSQELLSTEAISSIRTAELQAHEHEIDKFTVVNASNAQPAAVISGGEPFLPETYTYSVAYDYFSNLTDFGTNSEGSCTVLAAAILLGYYDNYVDDSFVPQQFEDGVGTRESFHQHLIDYVYGTGEVGGISLTTAANRMNEYFADQYLHAAFVTTGNDSPALRAKNVIQSGHPALLSFRTVLNNEYISHCVVAYSVDVDAYTGAALTFTVHTGWHNREVPGFTQEEYVISSSWTNNCGELVISSTGLKTHQFGTWADDGIYNHKRLCSGCDFAEYEAHTNYWNSSTQLCRRCGHRGPIASLPLGMILLEPLFE